MSALPHDLYGLLAEFETPDAAVAATRRIRELGYTRVSAYSPYPNAELAEAVGVRSSPMPLIVLLGGIAGGLGAFAMQYWMLGVDYPLNVAGRPLFSWPPFIPITFELTVLTAAIAGAVGYFFVTGLPKPYHPLFTNERFRRATQDRLFVCVEAGDPKFDPRVTRRLLEDLGGAVSEVRE